MEVEGLKITLQLRGPLKKFGPGAEPFNYEVKQESCNVEQLLELLDIPRTAISFVSVNGGKVDNSFSISDGDSVVVYPHVAGG